MIISDMDNSTYTGSAYQIVFRLRGACLTKPPSNDAYMLDFAKRASFFTKIKIRTNSESLFIKDTVKAGFFRRIK